MLSKSYLTIILFASIFFSSCSSIYMPGVPNTPMLTTKGEFAGGAHVSLRGNVNVNSAYAVSDHLAAMVNFGFLDIQKKRKDIDHRYFEIGGGYFKTFGPDDNRILEFYAGMGTANSFRVFRDFDDGVLVNSDIYDAKYTKTFVQANYSSKKTSKVRLLGIDFGLNYGTAWRLSFVSTNDFKLNGVPTPNEDNIFIEPVFFTRMVLSEQFQLQYTSGSNIGLRNRKYLNAGHSVFSVGAVINLGRKPKK
ncbi:hypothetical protein ACQKCH_05530 [Nubsella zeaxanthinifaciens]|uniref:hypothetical protein n=1 Tax=Nubsella zeaxanthinifaciens TaxID=392412 RepID=UPI003CFF3145